MAPLVQVNFFPAFVKGETATVQDVADHVEHIANVAGRMQCVLISWCPCVLLIYLLVALVSAATSTVSTRFRRDWRTFPNTPSW